ncbi:hypothetical protein [Streptomyces sp. S186]|uniref:hypothetical protein n=1 Tax=Streptomyces sp. S186 TaxID=3434395 RepID=UPI003F6779AC
MWENRTEKRACPSVWVGFQGGLEAGCSRLEWHADADNPRAHEFHTQFVTPDPPGKRLRYRLEGEDLLTAHARWPQP